MKKSWKTNGIYRGHRCRVPYSGHLLIYSPYCKLVMTACLWFCAITAVLYSELSENYENMTLKLNFENCKKLVPTQIPTRTFEFKFGMQGLTSDATLLSLASVYRWYSCTCIAFVRKDCILLEVQYLQRQTRDIWTYSYDTPFKLIVFCYIFEGSITVIFPF